MTGLPEQGFVLQLLEALDVPLRYLIASPTTTLLQKGKQGVFLSSRCFLLILLSVVIKWLFSFGLVVS